MFHKKNKLVFVVPLNNCLITEKDNVEYCKLPKNYGSGRNYIKYSGSIVLQQAQEMLDSHCL